VCSVCAALAVAAAASAQSGSRKAMFEVASIKPITSIDFQARILHDMNRNAAAAGSLPIRGRRVELRAFTLEEIISDAYRVRSSQIVGPGWLSESRFNVDAIIPSNAPVELANEMLQSLLEERFGLICHRATQNQGGYLLVIAKGGPKLTSSSAVPNALNPSGNEAADAAKMARSAMKHGAATEAGWRQYQYKGCTVARFAGILERLLHASVVDSTKLDGKYDITLRLEETSSPNGDNQAGIFAGVRALGLKLEASKVPVDTLVIDKISKTATPN